MKYYCFNCGLMYSHGSDTSLITKGHGMFTKHFCTCGDKVYSCRTLLQRRVQPPEANCEKCNYRFKCWTE